MFPHKINNIFHYLIILGLLCIGSVLAIFQVEDKDDGIHIFSPFARHKLSEMSHYILFVIHDISAFLTLAFFVYLFNVGKSNPNHRLFGRLLCIPLLSTLITGFMLINKRANDSSLTTTEVKFFTICLQSQGWNFITISLNAFIFKRWVSNKSFSVLLIMLHCYDVILGLKSVWLLFSIIFGFSGLISDHSLRETAIQLLIILTIPQLINEGIYLYIHYQQFNKDYRDIKWTLHHNMSVYFLLFMSIPGIIFSSIHDKYWIFTSEGITSSYLRTLLMIIPVIIAFRVCYPIVYQCCNNYYHDSDNKYHQKLS